MLNKKAAHRNMSRFFVPVCLQRIIDIVYTPAEASASTLLPASLSGC